MLNLSVEERFQIANRVLPEFAAVSLSAAILDVFARYPQRKEAFVARVAPSPTGFMHLGVVYAALINSNLSRHAGGKFLLRIEDTDEKRYVSGATELIIHSLKEYDLAPDEGFVIEEREKRVIGSYGPYLQSERKELYRLFAYALLVSGFAYPCFASEEELKTLSENQRLDKLRPGYYGRFAKWRDCAKEQIVAALDEGLPFVIRLRSTGNYEEKERFFDEIHGWVNQPQSDLDVVLIKKEGGSLYHFAHGVDDTLMRVSHVIRGDEWLSSVPLHRNIFQTLSRAVYEICGINEFAIPKYAHLAPIQKIEISEEVTEKGVKRKESRRKLSKRKDPEANISFFSDSGIPAGAVKEYLLNIADSGFEEWRKNNPNVSSEHFTLQLNRFPKSGALMDLVKINNISRDFIASLPLNELFPLALKWLREYDQDLFTYFISEEEYVVAALNIEREGKKPSKRLTSWRDLRPQTWWFFDELFKAKRFSWLDLVSAQSLNDNLVKEVLKDALSRLPLPSTNEEWFQSLQEGARSLGLAMSVKEFKNAQALEAEGKLSSKIFGTIADYAMIYRLAISNHQQTPDLFQILQVMGDKRVGERLQFYIQAQ